MASQGQAPHSASPALIVETLSAHQRTAALIAAIELDLFRAVGDGPADASTLAQRCSASERGTRILCDYLVVLGFLQKADSTYSHTPTSEQFLDPRSTACIASTARFLALPEMIESTRHLTEIVRTGRTVLPGEGSVEPDNPIWVEFAHSMAPMMAPVAAPLGQTVLRWRSGPMQVLDIAAGHGLFGIQIAMQNPEAHIVAQDWAAVLEVAQQNAERAGVADRYQKLPGSAFDVEYGGPYDAVLLTNFLHHFDQPTCVSLLKKVRAAMKPGGVAATLEFVPNEDRVSPPMPASFSMVMLVSTASGDAYTFSELEKMHLDAGFASVEPPIVMGPHSVIIAHV
ncbi:MAG TPA: class I SAM-dependent methyltransferase [Candidatus Sulfopaludibacter sp.]|jgi:ubiquinone/menaquinone biosynthesis C-methylase UbiE|nr:class I SAM-dependent methyltransferase [Candidatus Sulfopaludibacter sp.]